MAESFRRTVSESPLLCPVVYSSFHIIITNNHPISFVLDTNDILTFSRVWTGFNYAARRGNYEEKDPNRINWMDPMTLLYTERHDWFPKKNLLDDWIGDRYPLCYDLPARHFLKKDAVYR